MLKCKTACAELKHFFSIALFLFSTIAFSQPLLDDRLEQARALSKAGKLEEARHIWEEIIAVSEDSMTVGLCLNNLGVYAMGQDELALAIDRFNQALAQYPRAVADSMGVATHYNLGLIYKNLGAYEIAANHMYRALEETGDHKNMAHRAKVLNVLGNLHRHTGDFELATDLLHQAEEINIELNDSNALSHTMNNLGIVYLEMEFLPEAQEQFKQSLEIKTRLKDTAHLASGLYNLGDVAFRLGDFSEARGYFEQSLYLRKKENESLPIADCFNMLGSNAIGLGNYPQASAYLDSAFAIAKKNEAASLLLDVLSAQLKLFEKTGDWRMYGVTSRRYVEQYKQVMDEAKQMEMQRLNVLHRVNQLTHENEQLELDHQVQSLLLETEKTRAGELRLMVIMALAILLLLSLLAYFFWKLSRIRNRQKAETEKLILETHHRIKNNLQMLSGLLTVQLQKLKSTDAIEAIEQTRNRVAAMNLIHQDLSAKPSSEMRLVDFDRYLLDLVQNLLLIHDMEGKVQIESKLEPLKIEVNTAQIVGLIANEVICNSLKYGMTHPSPKITLQLYEETPGVAMLSIYDNGLHPEPEHIRQEGVGSTLIRSLVNQIGAKLITNPTTGLFESLGFYQKK